MFCLKLCKIYLNTVPKTVILDVKGYVLIESIYNKFIEKVMVSYLNIKFLHKKNF